MPLYEFATAALVEIKPSTYGELKLKERGDMQRVLQENIEVLQIEDDRRLMVICEEFGDWQDARRRIDLLCVDSERNLVVVELKRNDGSHMELQALRYAAMISPMRFEQAVEAHRSYLAKLGRDSSAAESDLRSFLEDEGDVPISFTNNVRIILVAGDFNTEITTSVLWLNAKGLDITCVRMLPHPFAGKVLVAIEQVVPLPQVADYQIAIREKAQEADAAEVSGRDLTRYRLKIGNETWEDLPKRRLVLHIFREAVARGVSPEKIQSDALPWRPTDLLVSADGTMTGAQLSQAVTSRSTRRYFCADGEYVNFGGRTYALTKMWGTRTEEAVKQIINLMPAGKAVSFEPMPND
jgi:hypothetical protein